jgi:RND family efflux transporter MFP subunit
VEQEIVPFFEFTGRTEPVESVELRARVPGFLNEIHFEEGQTVEKGQLLYTIESAPYEAELQAARAALARAQASVAETEFDLEKTRDLHAREVASNQELVIAQAKYDAAVGDKLAAEAAIAAAEIDLSYTKISAPISGLINQTRVDPGNLVGQGEPTLLTTIVPWDPMHVYFTVNERDVLMFRRRAIARGAVKSAREVPIYLRLADGTEYPRRGTVDYVDNRIDPETGTIRVRAIFDNPDELLVPGVFARVLAPQETRGALLVPEVALQRDMAGYYVLAVEGDGDVVRKDVEVGTRFGRIRVVESGITTDDRIIINGLQRARPGIKVDATEGEFDTSDATTALSADTQPATTQPGEQRATGEG